MSARIIPLFPEPAVDRDMELQRAQRAYLAVEEALSGDWSDSVLIAQLALASPLERGAIIRELEARASRRPS